MRISDWSSDVCSSDLDERPTAEGEEGEKEARCGECDRKTENDLDKASKSAGSVAKCERQPGDDDDDHRKDLCDGPLDRLQDLLQCLLPGHGRTRCASGWRTSERQHCERKDGCRSAEHRSELQ